MNTYLKSELKRALISPLFLISYIAACVAGFSAMVPEMFMELTEVGVQYFYGKFYNSALSLLAPLIAVIPFAQSYAIERNSGFSRFVLQRANATSYYAVKCIACALSGGLVLALPLITAVIVARIFYPFVPDPNGNWYFIGSTISLSQHAYIAATIGIAFAFGVTFSLLGLATSTLFRSPYYVPALSMGVYIVPTLVTSLLMVPHFNITSMWDPGLASGVTSLTLGLQYSIFLVGSLYIGHQYFRFREE